MIGLLFMFLAFYTHDQQVGAQRSVPSLFFCCQTYCSPAISGQRSSTFLTIDSIVFEKFDHRMHTDFLLSLKPNS